MKIHSVGILPAILFATSPWARITIDAASFGRINLVLLLKPEQPVNPHWRMDEQLLTSFLWLSRVGQKEPGRISHPVSPLLQERLRQLYQSTGMPYSYPHLTNGLCETTQEKENHGGLLHNLNGVNPPHTQVAPKRCG